MAAKQQSIGMSNLLLQYHSERSEDTGRGLGLSTSNALQVVTEALNSSSKFSPLTQIEIKQEEPFRPLEDNYREVEVGSNAQHPNVIVSSDNDVTNGFVKDGKLLPYVFEASDTGVRKRASKILPVCGVCGKRFVCVTTMKRHLVTHTGEKPFSCKICGKQYTQKGNLRVHERTHRNDRPFECNICHQKFYRKEPMQKHQWRQHGVVHFKSRPVAPATCSTPAPAGTTVSTLQTPNLDIATSVERANIQQHQLSDDSSLVRPLSDTVAPASRAQHQSILHYRVQEDDHSEEQELSPKISRDSSPGLEQVPPHSSPKPIKLKMKFAYHKHELETQEQELDYESIPENLCEMKLRSSPTSSDPINESRATGSEPFQCIGCTVVFDHKPALKAHQTCPDDKERPFRCCRCGYKFRQKAHLQKHQWRIHRRDQEPAESGTTITMQDIINHGVEKSFRENAVVRGKTSSKYYSEILGLEYEASDDSASSNDTQPLDLSPAKKSVQDKPANPIPAFKIRELENNPLLSQPPLPKSPDPRLQVQPTVNQISSSSLSFSKPPVFPTWKRQRTESESSLSTSHNTLPPISILQKPPGLSLLSRRPDAFPFKHSALIREGVESTSVATDLRVEKKPHQPDFMKEQLYRLQNQNARTV